MTTKNTGDYVCVETGNWFSVYECRHCKKRVIEQPDGDFFVTPETKCTSCELSRSKTNDGKRKH